jgi:hypothetical protein
VPGRTQVPSGRQSVFAYGAITLYGRLSHTFPLTDRFVTPMCRALQPRPCKQVRFGLIPVRSPLLGKSFLFLRVLRCFSSPGALPPVYVFNRGCCGFATADFSIRKSSDQRLYTASRGLSQCPASFIGTWRQGIHHKPLVASPRDAEKLILFGLHHFNCYSVGKVRIHRLTGERCSRSQIQGIGHPSIPVLLRPACPGRHQTQFGPAHTAGPRTSRGAVLFLDFMSGCR